MIFERDRLKYEHSLPNHKIPPYSAQKNSLNIGDI